MTIAIVGNEAGKYPAVLDETGLFVDSPVQFGPAPPLGLGSLLGGQVNVAATGDTWKRIRQADFRGGAGQLRQLDLSRFMKSVGVMPVDDMDTRLKRRIVADNDYKISWPLLQYNWYDYLQIGTAYTWLAVKLYDGVGGPDYRLIEVYDNAETDEDTSLSGHACEGQMGFYGWHGSGPMTFGKWTAIGVWSDFANQPPWTDDDSRENCNPIYWDGKVWQFNGYYGPAAEMYKYCWTADLGVTAWSSLQSLEGSGQLQRVVPYARQLLLCWTDRLDGFAGKQYLIEEFPCRANANNFQLAVVYQGVFYFNVRDTIMAYGGTMRELVRPDPPLLAWEQIVGGCAYRGKLYFATYGVSNGLYCCDLASGAVRCIYEKSGGLLYYPGMTCLGDLKFVEYDYVGGGQLYHVELDDVLGSGDEHYSTATGQLYLSWADAGYPEINKVWGYVTLDCQVPTGCTLTAKYSTDGDNFTTLGVISGAFDGDRVVAFPAGVVKERVQFLVEFATTVEDYTPILRQLIYGVALAPDNKHRLAATVVATDDIAGAAAAGYGEQVIRLLEDKARRVVDFDWLGPRAIQLYNSATYSDELAHATTENAGGTDYITLDNATTSWALYVLSMIPFSVLKVWMETANANAATLNLEYYNGSAWVDVPRFSDGTASGGATLAQDGDIVVDEIPDDMELVTVNGETGFGYRLKWSATLDADCKIDVVQIAGRYFLELENAMMEVGLEDASGNRIYEGRIPVTLTEV